MGIDLMTQTEIRHFQHGRLRMTQTGWQGMQKNQHLCQDDRQL
jgi:hypothetical protein